VVGGLPGADGTRSPGRPFWGAERAVALDAPRVQVEAQQHLSEPSKKAAVPTRPSQCLPAMTSPFGMPNGFAGDACPDGTPSAEPDLSAKLPGHVSSQYELPREPERVE
jgi:hypothetical protein